MPEFSWVGLSQRAPNKSTWFGDQQPGSGTNIDYLFEHEGRVYLCDWKGDWLPSWDADRVRTHCENNYDIQARLYTLAVLRLAGLHGRDSFERRFGGVLYCFLRGMRPGDEQAGIAFRRPDWQTVLNWQTEMLGSEFWGIG